MSAINTIGPFVWLLAATAAAVALPQCSGRDQSELTLTAAAPADPVDGLAVFPGAEGFGTRTRAGRGGRVHAVTSLADNGPGTLRAALRDPSPKIIVFRVGGIIELKSHLFVEHPFVTIAGQTAPGDGIVLKDFGVVVSTNDVLIQYLRVRPGNKGAVRPDHNDAVAILGPNGTATGAHNVVLDHISASWGEDETISTWFGPHDITVSWSIVSEAFNHSRHAKQTHSAGLIVGDHSDRVSIHHNLLAHNDFRNPLVMSGGTHDVVNNVVYDWGSLVTEILADAPMSVNVVGNWYRPGPSSKSPYPIFINPSERGSVPKIFASGNMRFGEAAAPRDGWAMVQYGWRLKGAPDNYRAADQFPTARVAASDAKDALTLVLTGAGATSPRRDATDNRIVADVRNGTGSIIDSPDQVGGYPVYAGGRPPVDSDGDGMPDEWERRLGLDPANPSDANQDRDGNGYTNVEEYLHELTLGPSRRSGQD